VEEKNGFSMIGISATVAKMATLWLVLRGSSKIKAD